MTVTGDANLMPQGGYNPEHFAHLDSVEDRHFWFQARRRVIGDLVRQIARDFPDGYRVLEVGCGNGSLLSTLESACSRGRVFGMDIFLDALQRARQRSSCTLIQASIHEPPFARPFELVGLFDVLEHIPDDGMVLRSIHNLLTPGGSLLLTVPAHMFLWSYFDRLSDHVRRYSPLALRAKLVAAGFQVEFLSEFMTVLFPLMWISRRLTAFKRRGRTPAPWSAQLTHDLKIRPVINSILTRLLGSESRLFVQTHRSSDRNIDHRGGA